MLVADDSSRPLGACVGGKAGQHLAERSIVARMLPESDYFGLAITPTVDTLAMHAGRQEGQ
jgi:hypothetical protein